MSRRDTAEERWLQLQKMFVILQLTVGSPNGMGADSVYFDLCYAILAASHWNMSQLAVDEVKELVNLVKASMWSETPSTLAVRGLGRSEPLSCRHIALLAEVLRVNIGVFKVYRGRTDVYLFSRGVSDECLFLLWDKDGPTDLDRFYGMVPWGTTAECLSLQSHDMVSLRQGTVWERVHCQWRGTRRTDMVRVYPSVSAFFPELDMHPSGYLLVKWKAHVSCREALEKSATAVLEDDVVSVCEVEDVHPDPYDTYGSVLLSLSPVRFTMPLMRASIEASSWLDAHPVPFLERALGKARRAWAKRQSVRNGGKACDSTGSFVIQREGQQVQPDPVPLTTVESWRRRKGVASRGREAITGSNSVAPGRDRSREETVHSLDEAEPLEEHGETTPMAHGETTPMEHGETTPMAPARSRSGGSSRLRRSLATPQPGGQESDSTGHQGAIHQAIWDSCPTIDEVMEQEPEILFLFLFISN